MNSPVKYFIKLSHFYHILGVGFMACRHTVIYQAQAHGSRHVGERAAHRRIHMHKDSVDHKPRKPYDQIGNAKGFPFVILFYEKVIHDLDGDHGSEHGTDQIQKIGDIIHGKHHGRRGTYDRNSHSRPLFLDLLGNGHTGYPRGIRVQEGGCHRGKYNDEQARQSQARTARSVRSLTRSTLTSSC